MTIDDEKPITWGDLNSPILINTLSRIVVKVIRNCVLIYSPIIIIIFGVAGWYFDGLSSTQTEIIKIQAKQGAELTAIYNNVNEIKLKLSK